MSDDTEDVLDITSICGGLNINIGTLNQRTIPAMFAAGTRANELSHKVLLDPVGAGASKLRTETALELMHRVRFDVIRGNISEIKTLANGSGTTKGVDADMADAVTDDNLEQAIKFAETFAASEGCIIAITGAIDLVTDGKKCFVIRNGRPEMGRITGTGCQLSALITAFLVANPEKPLEAAAAAVCAMGLAGEIGWGFMTFPMDDITGFLYLIGSVFAPMIAILIADFFVLKRDYHEYSFCWSNLIVWLAGFALYRYLMTVDLVCGNTLPDMLITLAAAIAVDKIAHAISKPDKISTDRHSA